MTVNSRVRRGSGGTRLRYVAWTAKKNALRRGAILARFRAVLVDAQAVNAEHVQREMLVRVLFVPVVQLRRALRDRAQRVMFTHNLGGLTRCKMLGGFSGCG